MASSPILRIALAQINPTVGALAANAERIRLASVRAAEAGAALVVFPELALSGYPPEDLVLKPHFLAACERTLTGLAAALPPGLAACVGTPLPGQPRARNAAALLQGGAVRAVYAKRCLPNYGVFDEHRVFSPGGVALALELAGRRIGVHICEDSWISDGPALAGVGAAGLSALVNLSASPYHRRKSHLRQAVLGSAARAAGAPLLYANLVGGQDELVFDGVSLAVDASGRLLARAAAFEEDLLLVDLPPAASPPPALGPGWERVVLADPPGAPGVPTPPRMAEEPEPLREVWQALTLGLRDYTEKNGFPRVLLAVSGGIDSALVAALAVDALGAQRVAGITLPSRFSSEGTYQDALRLGEHLGIEMRSLSIQPLFEQFLRELTPQWPGRAPDVAEENLQARIRGALVMALSNKFNWLVLTTGNKSEMATGYCTLYGDMAGGFAVIKDVPKTLVFDLCRWRNRVAGREIIPESTIERPPSAELRENQRDSDSLPPYEVLDAILEALVEEDRDPADLLARGFEPSTVARVERLLRLSEYKRRQAPPGVKITPKAFGRDRRLPLTNAFRETV
jgi:NAD+ synthase (glutamine-hydrolysing)